MKTSSASIIGVVRLDDEETTIALPVISLNGQSHLQVSFADLLGSYELKQFGGKFEPVDAREVEISLLNKERVLFFYNGGVPELLFAEKNKEQLQAISGNANYSPSLRLQVADVLSDNELRRTLENQMTFRGSDKSLKMSILQNTLFETVVANLRPDADVKIASQGALRASAYMGDGDIDEIPQEILGSVLSFTSLNAEDLRMAIKERIADFSQIKDLDRMAFDLQESDVNNLIRDVKSLRRQELRVSKILSGVLNDPRLTFAALKQYKPWAIAERDSVDRLMRRGRELRAADDRRRSFIVAQLIPEVMRSQFGARRGRLILDLARYLKDDPIVKEAIATEFRRRKHTQGVTYYRDQIASELDLN